MLGRDLPASDGRRRVSLRILTVGARGCMGRQRVLGSRSLLALAITLLFWSSAFAGIRAGLRGYSPGHLALLRFLVASATLAIYALATRMRLPATSDLPGIALTGFLGITVYHVALSYGERSVSAGAASFLINSAPVITAVLATIFLGERLGARGWVGIGISLAGVSLIAFGEGGGMRLAPGALLILIAALGESVYFILQKRYFLKYRPLEVTTYGIWAGMIFMLVFLPGLAREIAAAPLGATLSVVYLGICPAAIAYVTWAYFMSKAPAGEATSFLFLVPALAVVTAWLWLGEVPNPVSLLGGALALAGVLLVNMKAG